MACGHQKRRNYTLSRAAIRHGLILDPQDLDKIADFYVIASKRSNGQFAPFLRSRSKPAKQIALGRFIMQPTSEMVVDHINGNPWDNRRSNLRICQQADNLANARISANHAVGYKGVRPQGKKFVTSIQVRGKPQWLGTFESPKEAALAYDAAARAGFGEFAALNFPVGNEQSALRQVETFNG